MHPKITTKAVAFYLLRGGTIGNGTVWKILTIPRHSLGMDRQVPPSGEKKEGILYHSWPRMSKSRLSEHKYTHQCTPHVLLVSKEGKEELCTIELQH